MRVIYVKVKVFYLICHQQYVGPKKMFFYHEIYLKDPEQIIYLSVINVNIVLKRRPKIYQMDLVALFVGTKNYVLTKLAKLVKIKVLRCTRIQYIYQSIMVFPRGKFFGDPVKNISLIVIYVIIHFIWKCEASQEAVFVLIVQI